MSTKYPTSIDDTTTMPVATDNATSVLAAHHNNQSDALQAVETKLGTGASTATDGKFLVGNTTAGSSEWRTIEATDVPDISGTYAPIAKGVTNGDTHDHSGGDGAQIAYSSLSGTPTIPVKATGAEVDTGTDDAKFVTSKAIEDSSYVKSTGNIATASNIANNTGTTTTVLHGNASGAPSFGAVVEADLSLSDNSTGNVSTSKHGFAPKLSNVAGQFLDGTGNWSAPSGSGDVLGPATNTADYIPQWNGADSKTLKDGVAIPTGGLAGLTSPVFTTPQINDTTADHQYITAVSELTADRTVTLPLLTADDEFMFKTHHADLYGSGSMARQAIINGNFDVWQRGTSFTLSSGIAQTTADRWSLYANHADYSVSREDGTGVTGSQYCLKVQRANGSTQVTSFNCYYCGLEKTDSVKFRGKKLTLSFWAKKGANFSPTTFTAAIYTGTTGDENVWSMTGVASVGEVNPTLTTDWVKFSVTTTNVIAANVNQITIRFFTSACVGTAGGNDAFYIAQVQLCAGSVALPFMPKSYEEELRACQRYCYVPNTSGTLTPVGLGGGTTTSRADCTVIFPVVMRTTPTLTGTATEWGIETTSGTIVDLVSWSLSSLRSSASMATIEGTVSGTPLTVDKFYRLSSDGTANRLMIFSAEY